MVATEELPIVETPAKPEAQGRTGVPKTFYLEDDLVAAMNVYRSRQKVKPSQTAILNVALRTFLEAEGVLTPKDSP